MSCAAGGLTPEMIAEYAEKVAVYLPDSAGVKRFERVPDGAGGRRKELLEADATPGFVAVLACSVAPASGQQESDQGSGEKSRADFDVTFSAGADIRPTDQLVIVAGIAPEAWTEELASAGQLLDVISTDKGKSRAMNLIARCRRVV
jgi:hypothetical protein